MSERAADPERHDVPAATGSAGETLHLVRVRGEGPPLLFLHGSTVPASVAFATRFDGASMLDLAAAAGFDAWCLDFRGFGRSYRPPRDGGPVTFTKDAVEDVRRAIDHLRRVTGAARVHLLGWSWGATVAGRYAVENAADLDRLVLVAPQWLRDTPSPLLRDPAVLEQAYRGVRPDALVERWTATLPPSTRAALVADGWVETFRAALADPASGAHESPNGPLVEIARNWSSGLPVWDPARLATPVTVVVGDADVETPPRTVRGLLDALSGHPDLRYVEVAGATHFLPVEPARRVLLATLVDRLR